MRPMSLPVGLPALTDSDLVGQVARILTQAVVQGRLPPGSKVVEAGIARELGISRAPVREAARLLEKQGLLVAKPRGLFVRKLEIETSTRSMICGFASNATPACWRRGISRPERDALRRQLDILHKTADLDDPARQVEELSLSPADLRNRR